MPLFPYQEEGVRFISREGGSGLFLDMGLGKTCICLNALTEEMLPALVIAPKRVAEEVWPEERDKWRPDLTLALAAGTPARRKSALEAGRDITVISRDNMGDAVKYARRFKTMIIDESSGFKSPSSVRFKTAKKLIKGGTINRVWALTGTPMPNNMLDLWSQVFLLDSGAALGKTLTAYRERYFSPGRQLPTGVITEWNLRPGAEARIHQLLEPVALSMKAEGRVDLPPTVINDVQVPMTPTVRKLYKKFHDEYVLDLEMLGGEVHSADTAASLSARKAQLVAGFMYVDEAQYRDGAYDIVHWEKMRALQEIIDGTGSPVLVAYWYKAERDMILKTVPGARSINEPGVVADWNAGKVPVLLVHPASAGHGLNLQFGGHTLVWTTLPWQLELYQQTNARLPRRGQEHPVIIHRLLTPHSVDDDKVLVLEEKKTIQDVLLEHLESLI